MKADPTPRLDPVSQPSVSSFSRRLLLRSAAAGLAVAAIGPSPAAGAESAAPPPAAPGKNRPNILFLFSDQQRWDTLGCYGQKMPVSPNLDKLAAEGVRFELAFTPQPVCGPARSCLQTGRWATQTGCITNGIALPAGEKTLAHYLSAAGYEVGYIGKWHLASGQDAHFETKPVPPERRGGYKDFWLASDVLEFTSHGYDGHMFDAAGNAREFPPGRYRVDAQTDFAIEYLRGRKGERPFFLFVSYIEPHFQNDHKRFEGPHGCQQTFKDFPVPGDLAGTQGDWRESYPDYLGCCNSLDENVGRLRQELHRLGLSDNTVVLYASDHACHFRTRNAEYKRSCHDDSIRVPMLACGPGFAGGRVVRDLVSLIDLPPTVLTAAGVDVPPVMVGRPLQGLLDGTAKDWPREVFVQISESQTGRAIRTTKWKYSVRRPQPAARQAAARQAAARQTAVRNAYVEDFLYDLEKDPDERNNLVRDPALGDVRKDLAATLLRRMKQAGEADTEILPAPAVHAPNGDNS